MFQIKNLYIVFTILLFGVSVSACDNANKPQTEEPVSETSIEEMTEAVAEEEAVAGEDAVAEEDAVVEEETVAEEEAVSEEAAAEEEAPIE
jgi:hypothetical protein